MPAAHLLGWFDQPGELGEGVEPGALQGFDWFRSGCLPENKRLREHVDKLTLQRDAAVSNELLLQMALAEAQRDGATKAALVQPSRAVGSLRLIRTARATSSAASEGRVPTDSKPWPPERGGRGGGREVAMELLLA